MDGFIYKGIIERSLSLSPRLVCVFIALMANSFRQLRFMGQFWGLPCQMSGDLILLHPQPLLVAG
jgi:hypothetical protein